MLKIYIAGALTHHHEEGKNVYKRISEYLNTLGYDAYAPHLWGTDPIKDPGISPGEVWQTDHRRVLDADLLVSYVGQPSLGTGQEIEIARVTNTDIIIWWFHGEKVSRMARGNPAVKHEIEATDENDLYQKLISILKTKYDQK